MLYRFSQDLITLKLDTVLYLTCFYEQYPALRQKEAWT